MVEAELGQEQGEDDGMIYGSTDGGDLVGWDEDDDEKKAIGPKFRSQREENEDKKSQRQM